MGTQMVLDNDFASAEYISDVKMIKIVWKNKMPRLSDYQNVYNTCLFFQKNNPVDFTLADTTHQAQIPAEYSKWFVEYALPVAVRQGIMRMGIISSGNVMKLQHINNAFNMSKVYGIPFKVFKTDEAARKWLFSEGS